MPLPGEIYKKEIDGKIDITNCSLKPQSLSNQLCNKTHGTHSSHVLSQYKYAKGRFYRKAKFIDNYFYNLMERNILPNRLKIKLHRNPYLDLINTFGEAFFTSSLQPKMVEEVQNYLNYLDSNICHLNQKCYENIIIAPCLFKVINGKKYAQYQPHELEIVPIVAFHKVTDKLDNSDAQNMIKEYAIFTKDNTAIDLKNKKKIYVFINELMNLPNTSTENIYFEDILRKAHMTCYIVIFTDEIKMPENTITTDKCNIYLFERNEKHNINIRYENSRQKNYNYYDKKYRKYHIDISPENNNFLDAMGQIYDSIETRSRNAIHSVSMTLSSKIDHEIYKGTYKE